MKTVVLIHGALVCALFPIAAESAAATLSANSNVTAVTAYADRAVVTRTAKLQLSANGATEVTFDRLPGSLVEQSITVAGRGTAQATILDVTTRDVHTEVTSNERVQAAEEELHGLAKQRRVLDDRSAVLNAPQNSLFRVEAAATAAPAKDSAPRMTIEESLKLLAFLEEQRTKILAERQALDAHIEELTRKQTTAERRLAALRDSRTGRSHKLVTVRIDAATTGELELAISYAVPGASWTPSYDARASSNDPGVDLGYFGIVRQNTGEDWNGVALTLSTARPSLGGGAPESRIWVVDIDRPRPSQTVLGTAQSAASAPTVALSEFRVTSERSGGWSAPARPPPPPLPTAVAEAAVETAATSASFKIATPATVPSDNSPQKVPITTVKLASLPEYTTAPKELAAAFLTAKVTNSSEFPLLPGAINVFLDGTFVATSALRTVMPGENFELALGADEGIAVKHRRVQRFAEDTGLTSRGRRITYEYVFTLQNNKRVPARLSVADHVPVSRYERIVVKMISPSEKELKPAADGALKWTLDLKPGEKRELALKFSVEHPGELVVAGLE